MILGGIIDLRGLRHKKKNFPLSLLDVEILMILDPLCHPIS